MMAGPAYRAIKYREDDDNDEDEWDDKDERKEEEKGLVVGLGEEKRRSEGKGKGKSRFLGLGRAPTPATAPPVPPKGFHHQEEDITDNLDNNNPARSRFRSTSNSNSNPNSLGSRSTSIKLNNPYSRFVEHTEQDPDQVASATTTTKSSLSTRPKHTREDSTTASVASDWKALDYDPERDDPRVRLHKQQQQQQQQQQQRQKSLQTTRPLRMIKTGVSSRYSQLNTDDDEDGYQDEEELDANSSDDGRRSRATTTRNNSTRTAGTNYTENRFDYGDMYDFYAGGGGGSRPSSRASHATTTTTTTTTGGGKGFRMMEDSPLPSLAPGGGGVNTPAMSMMSSWTEAASALVTGGQEDRYTPAPTPNRHRSSRSGSKPRGTKRQSTTTDIDTSITAAVAGPSRPRSNTRSRSQRSSSPVKKRFTKALDQSIAEAEVEQEDEMDVVRRHAASESAMAKRRDSFTNIPISLVSSPTLIRRKEVDEGILFR